VIAAAALATLLAFSPFTKEEEHVREGNEQLLRGDAGGALLNYEAAERAVGERAEIDFDRAHAALRLGRGEDATASLRRAAARGEPALASQALQNLGHTLAEAGDRAGALAAYSEALRKDPQNEDARHDLEVLLRRKAAEKPPQTPGGGKREAPRTGGERRGDPGPGQEGQPPGAPAPPEQPSPGEKPGQRPSPAPERPPPEAPEPGGTPEAGPPAPGETPPGMAPPAPGRTRQEAEQLLDALRAREQKLPLAGRARAGSRRTDASKDW
jgi:Ca-activated chloride channel homolog